jgi:hypothetical protein
MLDQLDWPEQFFPDGKDFGNNFAPVQIFNIS